MKGMTISWTESKRHLNMLWLAFVNKNGIVYQPQKRFVLKSNLLIGQMINWPLVSQNVMLGHSRLMAGLSFTKNGKNKLNPMMTGMNTIQIFFLSRFHCKSTRVKEGLYHNGGVYLCRKQLPQTTRIASIIYVIC